ncbi:MAG: hypothetical protein ACXVA3_17725 [Vulcanimicrobiaceae bacterium]
MAQTAAFRIPVLLAVFLTFVAAGTPVVRGTAVDPDMRSAVPLFSTEQAACSGFTQDHAGETVTLSSFTRHSAHLLKDGTAIGVIRHHTSNCQGSTLDLYEIQVLNGQFKGQRGYITAPSFIPS